MCSVGLRGTVKLGLGDYEQHFSHYTALFLSHLIHSYKGSLQIFRPFSFFFNQCVPIFILLLCWLNADDYC